MSERDVETLAEAYYRARTHHATTATTPWASLPAFKKEAEERSVRYWLLPALAQLKATVAAEALNEVSADLYRDHDMPPDKDSRPYSYRMGWWDGVHHAAKVAKDRARAAATTPEATRGEGGNGD